MCVFVVWCQVEITATSWSLVQWSPTVCGTSLCDIETSWMRRPWPNGGCRAINKQIIITIEKKERERKKSKVQTISTVVDLMAVQSLPNAHSSKPLRMLHERLLSSPSVRRTLWKSVRPSAGLDWTESTHLRRGRRHSSRLTLIFYTLIVFHFATVLCRLGFLYPNKTVPVLVNSTPYCLTSV